MNRQGPGRGAAGICHCRHAVGGGLFFRTGKFAYGGLDGHERMALWGRAMRNPGLRALGIAVLTRAIQDLGVGNEQDQATAFNFLSGASPGDAAMLELWCLVAGRDIEVTRAWVCRRTLPEWRRWWARRSMQKWRLELVTERGLDMRQYRSIGGVS